MCGIDDGCLDLCCFQALDGTFGGAAPGRHLLPQFGRTTGALQGKLAGAGESLLTQHPCLFFRESEVHGGVLQCFHQVKHIGRSAARDGSYRVHFFFIIQPECLADRLQQHFRLLAL